MIRCAICLKEFKNKKSLSNHRRWHDLGMYKQFQHRFRLTRIGERHSDETKRKIGQANLGQNNGVWSGHLIGYWGIHDYIKYHLPRPNKCQNCNQIKKLDLANKSGVYLRELSDWEYLCRRCHMLKDGRLNNLILRNKGVSNGN